MYVLYFICLVILGYLTFSVVYLAVFALAGKLGKADDSLDPVLPPSLRKIGVLIPAYKEDAVIVSSVRANLKQQYPASRFDLIVIADSLQPHTLARLAELPIRVIEVSFPISTVANAIRAALAHLPDTQYDLLVVADADNLLAPDFLSRVNLAFEQGWRAVQGHRIAKNTNTPVAVLDAISEEINNHLFRKGSRALGLSASIIGSGMGIETGLMKTALADLRTLGGYDKELEMNLVLQGHTIGYLEQALVYDEKVAQRAVFQNQRTRWIAAQWQFAVAYFGRGLTELRHGRLDGAFMLIKALVLPRVLLLGVLTLAASLGLLSGQWLFQTVPVGLLLVLCGSLFLSVPTYLRQRITGRELLQVPVLMFSFAKATVNIRKAFSRFMHTPHAGQTDVQLPQ